jgi:hypothetical protein
MAATSRHRVCNGDTRDAMSPKTKIAWAVWVTSAAWTLGCTRQHRTHINVGAHKPQHANVVIDVLTRSPVVVRHLVGVQVPHFDGATQTEQNLVLEGQVCNKAT